MENFIVSSFILVNVSSSRLGVDICKSLLSSSSFVGSSERSVAIVLVKVFVLSWVFQVGIVVLMVSNSSCMAMRALKRLNCSSVFCVLLVAS